MLFLEVGQSFTACSFSSSVLMPSPPILWPKNSSNLLMNQHLSGWSFRPDGRMSTLLQGSSHWSGCPLSAPDILDGGCQPAPSPLTSRMWPQCYTGQSWGPEPATVPSHCRKQFLVWLQDWEGLSNTCWAGPSRTTNISRKPGPKTQRFEATVFLGHTV